MAGSWRTLLDNDAIIAMAGHEAFARGLVYARAGHVLGVGYDAEERVVTGLVRGSHRDAYGTSVQLASDEAGGLRSHRGVCSCPVAMDCKHAAALLVAARTVEDIQQQLQRPAWERALAPLVAAPDPVADVDRVPLALELEVQSVPSVRGYPGRHELRARPVQRGRSGRWVRSGVSWDELDGYSSVHLPEQREWLLALRSAAGPYARYTYPRSPWLSLAAVGTGMWSLLAAAPEVGLQLIGSGSRPVAVEEVAATAELRLARSTAGDLVVQPALRVGEQELSTAGVGLVGDPAHGLFHVGSGSGAMAQTLRLARLAEPVSHELRRLLLEPDPLQIPVADEERFLDDYVPRLRRKARVVTDDPTVELPAYLPPTLHLRAAFRPEHRVRLDWSFRYGEGDSAQLFDIDEPLDRRTVRDPARERSLFAGLPLPYDSMPHLAADRNTPYASAGQPVPAPHALVAGVDAVRLVGEVLPALAGAGVEIEEVGEAPDYRRVDEPPLVELSTTDDSGSDWFDLHITVSVEGEVLPFDQLFVALSRGEEYLILDNGVYLELDREEFSRLRELIEEARSLQEGDSPGTLRISTYHASLWEELLHLGVVVEQADRWSKTVNGLLGTTAVEQVDPPDTVQATLRGYQLEGYRWLAFLFDHGLGGILADDMGLGKTLQALALVCRARLDPGSPGPFLVVAPTSVVSNWAREAARFAPDLTVSVVEQTQAKRKTPLAELVAGADLVVTSYALLRLDLEAYQSVTWAGVILDEAQFVKNHRAKVYSCARQLRAPFKLAITGTPLENSLMDLWSLLSIVAPGLFPHPERFTEHYRKPIERGGNADLLDQLRRRIRPVMLRRTKEHVAAELPAKQEQVVQVVLEPRHLRLYQTHLQRERQKILGLIDDMDSNRFTILSSLTRLRQLSLDPSLVDPAHADVPASKIDVLVEHLREVVGEGHRALVFSQFTSFLRRVRDRLGTEGVTAAYLDGTTRHRDPVVEEFRSGAAPVFLISLKAGGFGLNLTEADYCFVLDPWWNPAAEAQAVDRTHRIGQTKTVMVYRLVAQGTIEEKVMELKERKAQLFDSVFSGDGLTSGALNADEIRALLG